MLRLLRNLPGADLAITCSDKKIAHAHNCVVVSGCNNFFQVSGKGNGHSHKGLGPIPIRMVLKRIINVIFYH